MSSFVAQVLAERERVKMEDLEKESYSLLNDALSLKHDYMEALESHYVKLMKPLNSTPYLVSFQSLHNSCRAVSISLQEVQPTPSFSDVQLETLSATIEEVKGYVCILKQLTDLDSTLSSAKTNYENRNLLESARNLGLCRTLLSEEASSEEIVEIIESIKRDWTNLCGAVMYELTNMWREYLSFKDRPRSSVKNLKVVQLNVCLKKKAQFLLVVEAMKFLDLQDHTVKTFGSMLLQHVFKPLVEHDCVVKKEVNASMSMMTLEIMIQENSVSPTYAIVLHNCRRVFEYLNENVNPEISENVNFLNMVGKFIDRKFCQLAFKMNFFDSKDIEKFSSDVYSTENFKKYLHEIGFIRFDIPSQGQHIHEMFDYLKNCTILEEASCIMHKKIFETVLVHPIFSPKYQYYRSLFKKVGPLSKDDLEKWDKIPNQLRISKSTQDLMDKISHLLEQAITKDSFECVRQMYTVKNIFDMYAILLPEECRELTDNSAHFSAIIYNNCTHFCEWIISLGPKYRDYFPRMSKNSVVTFSQEAITIQCAGKHIFQKYVKSQISHLMEVINESELSGKNFLKHEETLKGCIRTIETLKSTWENVLAYHVYVKTMGEILSSIMKEWTMKILMTGKISQDLAVYLRVLIRDVLKRLNSKFNDDELSVVQYLDKLKSIRVVLEGSTFEIIHKWRKGEGPLAESLTADELKKLVRSLFEAQEMVYILNNL
ncbi:centromere/kinetochore protein zw10 homolog [Ischnura elegans]|uniref:centromere/kinetochore protein zw10 homolog n=1 Tax=Ischnura elegans TaxID=197161 RepID=UPI001ED8B6E1|nr:centromere/kinetochore protein zw10 homolog [Ischnura elegans]